MVGWSLPLRAAVATFALVHVPANGAAQDRAQYERSVVRVFALIDRRVQASATGFVVTAAGHVVAAPEIAVWRRTELRVFASDEPTDGINLGEPARVVAVDPASNIVLLHAPSLKAPALALQLRPVTRPLAVLVASFPRTVEGKWPRQVMAVSPGAILEWNVSNPLHDLGGGPRAFHRYGATPQPSTNGGPLVNACGEAVGIAVLAQSLASGTRLYAASAQLIRDAARSFGLDVTIAGQPCDD
jgi:S1-C subfamily serine protease